MIRLFKACEATPQLVEGCPADWTIPDGVVWVDLVEPSRDEELAIERDLGIEVPTREEMGEIEASSRLYRQDGATFVTIDLLHHIEPEGMGSAPVTFIVSDGPLITVRYSEPKAFILFQEAVDRDPTGCDGAVQTLLSILEAAIERTADVIEYNANEVEVLSQDVFNEEGRTNFTRALKRLGKAQHANAQITDSLSSLGRALGFLTLDARLQSNEVAGRRLRSLGRDVSSLTTHTSGVAQSVNFQLSAALGLINIEQSAIIKIFSVAAVAFLPPTLIASIYGMNFDHMPELHVAWAYPVVIAAMVVSAILPLWWFQKKGWL